MIPAIGTISVEISLFDVYAQKTVEQRRFKITGLPNSHVVEEEK